MEEARQTTDENQRRELYAQYQSIFAEELPSLPLFHPLYTYGVSTRVHNVQIGSLNTPAERVRQFSGLVHRLTARPRQPGAGGHAADTAWRNAPPNSD